MELHKVVHGGVRHQRVLVYEALAADLTDELNFAMMAFGVPLHVDPVHPHEATLAARDCFWRVRFFDVGVQHELLGISFATGDALERPVNTVNDSQMRH